MGADSIRATFAACALGLLGTSVGCGGATRADPPISNGQDGGGPVLPSTGDASSDDASSSSDVSITDGFIRADVIDTTSDASVGRCANASYTSAPDGGRCDPSRIQVASPEGPTCSGPAMGQLCDVLQFSFAGADASAVPVGFSCTPESGTMLCESTSFAGGSHILDTATLDVMCSITQTFPQSVVTCGHF
jgi:hypothetical protein